MNGRLSQAIHQAAGAIKSGSGELFIAGGVESMSRVPMPGFNPMLNPNLIDLDAYIGMGHTAENLAKKYSISREEQEKMALESHQKASKAQENGQFIDEIITINDVNNDGCIRPETSLESMANLKPAFDKNGTVTAGLGIRLDAVNRIATDSVARAIENADLILVDEVGKLVSESKEFSAILKEALKCGKPMLITMHKRSRNPLLQSIRKRDDLRTLEVTPINSAILPSKAVNILKTGMV